MSARPSGTTRVLLAAGLCAAAGALIPASASAATVEVHVGDFNQQLAAVYTAVYPQRIVVKRGDRVRFHIRGFDSVTFPRRGGQPPPLIAQVGGQNPATADAAGNPFWWGGTTPVLGLNPVVFRPTANTAVRGTALVHSGLPEGPRFSFTASFPRVGTYTVRSVVHPNLRATVVVLPRNSRASITKGVARRAAREKAADLRTARRLVRQAAPANTVLVGPGTSRVAIFGYQPAQTSVRVGESLTFRMAGRNENHTVTFGPEAALIPLAESFAGPTPAAQALYPSDPPPPPPQVTATSHGDGFVNSGVLADPGTGPGLPRRFTVTFPEAGEYDYLCLIHPDMKGTVTVTP